MYTLIKKSKSVYERYFKVLHVTSYRETEKSYYWEVNGKEYGIDKDDILFIKVVTYKTSEIAHKNISSHFGSEGEHLIESINGDFIDFDYNLDTWYLNGDTILNGHDVVEAVETIVREYTV